MAFKMHESYNFVDYTSLCIIFVSVSAERENCTAGYEITFICHFTYVNQTKIGKPTQWQIGQKSHAPITLAIRLIHNPTIGMPCIFALTYNDLESLKHRRESQARQLFKKILRPTSCLHTQPFALTA